MPVTPSLTGAAIAAHRQRLSLSQQGLAALMNVTHQAVSKWEKGLALPDTETLLALAKLFGTSMEALLMGTFPEEEPSDAPEPEPESMEDHAPDLEKADLDSLNFSAVMQMLPFVSTSVADRLFRASVSAGKPNISQLSAIAPFVSTEVLTEAIGSQQLMDSNPEIFCAIAPFLPTDAVDSLVQSMLPTSSPRTLQALMPFVSSQTADSIVLSMLGMAPESSRNKAVVQPSQAPAALKRESPRMRLMRKLVEDGNTENLMDLMEDLEENEMLALVDLLLERNMYGELAELAEEMDENMQHALLDKALKLDDPELMHVLSEHL